MTFASPVWLLLFLAIPLLFLRRKKSAILFPSARLVDGLRPSLWQRLAWLPRVLRAACLSLLIVALARPQQPNEKSRIYAEGIAIQMVVDCSGSMQIEDFELDGEAVSRLEAVKEVFKRFVVGDGSLAGRPDDLIGLVKFANFPDVQCPLTLSHDVLSHQVDDLKTAIPTDDGTNIGDAVAWGLEDLKAAKAKSRVMILLTDGVNQPAPVEGLAQPLDPLEAAKIAQGLGVKIYTIGAGSTGGYARMKGQLVRIPPVDEQLLKAIAEQTGGKYYRASDTDGLKQIYSEIDRLEKTQSESVVYLDHKELFSPVVWAGLAMLGIEQFLAATRLRRIP
jgi:Ca-activated chloride channel family protein